MKRIGPAAVFAVLFSLPVPGLAQSDKPMAARPAAAKPGAVAAQPTAKLASDGPRRSRANEDARSCLELATNIEIHQCAEKYR